MISLAIHAAFGRRGKLAVRGNDYPTPDGTCIRDHVHVADMVDAHLRVLPPLQQASVTLNVGVGQGYSVREAIDSVARVTGRPVPYDVAPRRPGDPAALVADASRLRELTGWAEPYGYRRYRAQRLGLATGASARMARRLRPGLRAMVGRISPKRCVICLCSPQRLMHHPFSCPSST